MKARKANIPPYFTLCFLAWFCPPDLYETIEGDLIEQFETDVKEFGKKSARTRFVWNVIKFLRLGIIFRNKISMELNLFGMFLNHLKVSLR